MVAAVEEEKMNSNDDMEASLNKSNSIKGPQDASFNDDQEHLGHQEHAHDHARELRLVTRKRLWWALIINATFLVVEVIGGVWSGSLALLADAGHMLTDVAALALALFVAYLADRRPTPERTFGLLRAEVLGAFINASSLFLIVGLILREAWLRAGQPHEIDGPLMLVVAIAGLLANLVSALILKASRDENVNVQGAFLHMLADALGSVGAIVAGVVIWTTGWMPIDPIMSVFISLLIVWGSWGLMKRTVNILLEATPENIDYNEVKQAMEEFDHVEKVHDLHIWTISSGIPILTAHIILRSECCDSDHWEHCRLSVEEMLEDKFGITHVTLQVEVGECREECRLI